MLEIFLESPLALLRPRLVLPRPSVATAPSHNVESLFDLFSMSYCGIRYAADAVIFFTNSGDNLVPQKTIKLQEE